jgi:hypothetical protein
MTFLVLPDSNKIIYVAVEFTRLAEADFNVVDKGRKLVSHNP